MNDRQTETERDRETASIKRETDRGGEGERE